MRQLVAAGFKIKLVLADALYGELVLFLRAINEIKLSFVVAIRENHSDLMLPDQRICYTRWCPFECVFSNGSEEQHSIREMVFHKCRCIRFSELTSDPKKLSVVTTRFVMTNLEGELRHTLGNFYGLCTWMSMDISCIHTSDAQATNSLLSF